MDKRLIAAVLVVAAVVFLVLNFTLAAGTLLLLLAVACGIGAAYLFTTSRSGNRGSRRG